jgi:hypothetical protein
LFTGLWFYFDHYRTPIRAGLGSAQQTVGIAVVTFYNGQFVAGPRDFIFAFGTGGGYLITPMYRLIPVVVLLLVAGAFVYTEADAVDRIGAFLSGASLVTGYLVLAVVVVLVFNSLAPSDVDFFPLPLGMAVVSGILYPVVVGGAGGIVANELKGYFEDSTSTRGVEENM